MPAFEIPGRPVKSPGCESLACGALYLYASGGFNIDWLKMGSGLGFTIDSLAALVAFYDFL
jgi:hypothetical protein